MDDEESVSLLQSECIQGDENYTASWNNTGQAVLRFENETFNDLVPGECGEPLDDFSTAYTTEMHRPIKLQDGKEAHFFVSYCSKDSSRVVPLILKLEKNYNVKCLMDERDFQAGMHIYENIKRSLEKSTTMLIFLSENFNNSNHCKFEIDQVFVKCMETEDTNVIPVLLEQCEIPMTIKSLTYIDATRCDSDISAKIIEAFNKNEGASMDTERVNKATFPSWFAAVLLDLAIVEIDLSESKTPKIAQTASEISSTPKYYQFRVENGYYIDLIYEEPKWCYWSGILTEEVFLTSNTKQAIEAAQLKIPIETFQKGIDIVNSFRTRKRWIRYQSHTRVGVICYFLAIVSLTCSFLYALLGLVVFSRYVSSTTTKVEHLLSADKLTVPFIVIAVLPYVIYEYYKYRHSRDLLRLERRILQELTMETYKQGALFKLVCRRNCWNTYTTLRVTRYNVHPCLRFLAKRIKESVEEKLDKAVDSYEIFDKCADGLLRSFLPNLIDETPEDAPVIRHPVKNGKACFCQRLERRISDYVTMFCENCLGHFHNEFPNINDGYCAYCWIESTKTSKIH